VKKRLEKRKPWIFLSFLLLTFLLLGCAEKEEVPKVIRVIDGDTIEVEIGDIDYKVRLIGINAPEKGQPYADESTEALEDLVLFKEVRLEKDVSETDKYGRLLRYVYVTIDGREIFVNEEMIGIGYAQVMTISPDVKYADLFVDAQRNAKEVHRGLWKEEEKQQAEEVEQQEKKQHPAGDYIVYITKTGSKYHRSGCRYLSRSKIPIMKSEAIARGYTPCSVCNP